MKNRKFLFNACALVGVGLVTGVYLSEHGSESGISLLGSAQAQEAAYKEEPLVSPT